MYGSGAFMLSARMRCRALVVLVLSVACQREEAAPMPAPVTQTPRKDPAVITTAAAPAIKRPELPGDARHGWDLFRLHCVNCHGASRRGTGIYRSKLPTPPADLRDPVLLASRSDDQIAHAIMHGIAAQPSSKKKDMPSFSKELGEQDAMDVVAFLRGDSIYLVECFPEATHYAEVRPAVTGPPLYAAHAAAVHSEPVILAHGAALPASALHVGYVTFVELDLPSVGPTPVAFIADIKGRITRARVALPEPDNARASADIEAVLKNGDAGAPRLRTIIPTIQAVQDWLTKAVPTS